MQVDTVIPRATRPAVVDLSEARATRSGKTTYFGAGGGRSIVDADTRNYLDAKVDAVKAQNDARFAEVLAGMDKINSNLSAFGETVKVRLEALDGDVKDAREASLRAESAAKSVRWNIIATGIAIIGVMFAMWTIYAQGMELITALIGTKQ